MSSRKAAAITAILEEDGSGTSLVHGWGVPSMSQQFLPATRRSWWNPGVPGGIPADDDPVRPATVWLPDGDPYGGYSVDPALGNDTDEASTAINAAIQAAGAVATPSARKIVLLSAGTYRLTSVVAPNRSNVTLRGSGATTTKLKQYGASRAVLFNGYTDWPASAVALTADLVPGRNVVTVGTTTAFEVGDIVQIDQLDDVGYVFIFDAWNYKRRANENTNGPQSPGGYRSVTSMHVVTAKSGTTLTIDPPVRIAYATGRSAEVWKVQRGDAGNSVEWAGIEDLYVTGGTAGNIRVECSSYSWVYRVESDGSPTTGLGMYGTHISLRHGFRCTIEHCYVHHATEIVQGGGAYGISSSTSSSECLIQDCIAIYLNKCILTNVSGGGNVFGYNWIDNARTALVTWSETSADGSHQAFTHHDLWEGNYSENIGTDCTHGVSGWLTYLRNFGAGRCADADYYAAQIGSMRAVGVDAWTRETTFVGNVLHAHQITNGGLQDPVYQIDSHLDDERPVAIWRVGDNSVRGGGGTFDTETETPGINNTDSYDYTPPAPTFTTKSLDKLWRHGNWDNVTASINDWQAGLTHVIPDSWYLSGKPAFFGAADWPWVDALGATAGDRVKTLPAKARYDAGTPNE